MTRSTANRIRSGVALTWLLTAPAVAWAGQGAPGGDAAPPSAKHVLAVAFANRYEVDFISRIELVMRNRSGQEQRRFFHAVSKVIDGRVHSLGRLIWPHHLRGMAILTIENQDRSHDAFVYLPSLDRVRRVTTVQRGDSFFGSDVTYEDLERRRVEEYEFAGLRVGDFEGEPVYVIRARSLRNFSYARVDFIVARTDHAMLETRYFKRDQQAPFRVISAPREQMVERDGHVLPTRLTVRDEVRGTSTEVLITDLQVNPPIDEHVFSVVTLELQRPLPGRVGQEEGPPAGE